MSDIHLPRRNMRLVCPTCGLERHVPDDWREVVGVIGALAAKGWRVDPPWESEDLSRALGVPPIADADRHTALGAARWAKAIHQAVMAMALRPLMDPL